MQIYERKFFMKSFLCLAIAWILLIPLPINAKSPTYIKLGKNISFFRTEECKSKPGICFGLGKEIYPSQKINGYVGFELFYARKKMNLENRTWPGGMDPKFSDVVIGDIKLDISYLEVPVRIGYSFIIKEKRLFLQFFAGHSISIPVKNHTDVEIGEIIFLKPDERGKYKFDYVRWEEVTTSISRNIQIGVNFVFKPLAVDFIYTKAVTNTEGFTDLIIRDKLDSYQITLSYVF